MTSKADRSARVRAAFLEYRRTRDPSPLAEVFDLTAQELLLVAHHLASRGVAPEDLVQATFLEAIRVAESYDDTRPVAPWLCGILVNIARRQNREQTRVYEAWRLDSPNAEDPAELAYVREFASAVQDALEEFPAPQREVLTLRLVHGLSATQIAQALDRPVGSVKSWIHRGVERLKLVLPASMVAGLAAISSAAPLLEQVRESVLRRAAEVAPPAANVDAPRANAAKASTKLLGSRVAWVLASLAVVAVVFLAAMRESWGPKEASGVARADAAARRTVASTPPNVAGQRATVELGSPALSRVARTCDLLVRARFASDGAPAELTVRIEPRRGLDPAFRATVVRTDERGEARVEGLDPGVYVLTNDRTPPREIEVRPEGVAVEIEVPSGRRVRGRVVDGAGRPVAGAQVWMSAHDSLNEGEFVASTSSGGEFELRDASLERAFAVVAAGFAPSALLAVQEVGEEELEVELDAQARQVRGRVVDEHGAPLAGARVLVGEPLDPSWKSTRLEHALHAPLALVSDSDGAFCGDWLAAPYSARVRARAAGYAFAEGSLEGGELVLRLERGAVWRGSVPAECGEHGDVTLRVESASTPPFAPSWMHPTCGVAGGEAFELPGIAHGAARVNTIDGGGRARARSESAPDRGVVAWRVACGESSALSGTLRAWNGTAIAGARVRAVSEDGAASQALTKSSGEFEFDRALEGELTLSVHASDQPAAALLLRRTDVVTVGAQLELVVPVELLPSAYLLADARAVEGVADDGWMAVALRDNSCAYAEPLADGRLRFGPLAPGEHALVAYGPLGPLLYEGPLRLEAGVEVDCGELRAKPPGRLSVRLSELEPADRGVVDASLKTLDGRFGLTFFKLTDGRGTCLPTAPGAQVLVARLPGRGCFCAPVEVLEGANSALELPATSGASVTFRVLDRVFEPSLRIRTLVTRANDGEVVLDLTDRLHRRAGDVARRETWIVAPGEYRVELTSECGLRGASEFRLLDEARAVEVAVELR